MSLLPGCSSKVQESRTGCVYSSLKLSGWEFVVFVSRSQVPHQVDYFPWSSGEEGRPVRRHMPHRRAWPASGSHSCSEIFLLGVIVIFISSPSWPLTPLHVLSQRDLWKWWFLCCKPGRKHLIHSGDTFRRGNRMQITSIMGKVYETPSWTSCRWVHL